MGIDLSTSADMSYHPKLYDVHRLLDLHIEGEFESRLAVFTNWLLACQNVNLTGQRASGKTWIITHVAAFLPDKNGLYNLSAGSEKSAWYQAESMKVHSHIMIPELNKLPANCQEILKDWGEGKESVYNVVIFEAGIRRVQPYTLKPKPFIFCIADEQELKIGDQLRSRLTVVRTDITENQNLAVNIRQADEAMLPSNPKPFNPEEYEQMRQHVMTLPPWDEGGYKHPAANVFVGCIPTMFTDCRRDFPKYIKNTFGITRFHWKERLNGQVTTLDENNKVIKKVIRFVNPSDMYYNHTIYGNTLIESSLRCTNMERQLINILHEANEPINRNKVQTLVRKKGMNISAHMITRHLSTLADLGYVEIIKVGSSIATYTVGALFKDFSFNINWKDVIEECKKNMTKYYPEVAKEYIKTFCDKPIVFNPFNGIEINLLDIKYEVKKKDSIIEKFSKEELGEDMKVEEEEIVDDIV